MARLVKKVGPVERKRLLVVDTETNGHDPQEVIELAWKDMGSGEYFNAFYLPEKDSTIGALSTHHILRESLIGCPPSSQAQLPSDCGYIIGHNVDFDWRALGSPPHVKCICTLAIARSLYPELDSHKLGSLLYHFCGRTAETRERLKNAHSALADIEFCIDILIAMLSEHELAPRIDQPEDLWKFSESCRIPKVMAFGKHKGTPMEDLPIDYVRWMLRQDNMDPYHLIAVRNAHGL